MATATNFDAWLDDVDGDYEEVMALYDSVQNVSDMGLYQCVEGGRGDAWVVSSNHHPEALFYLLRQEHTPCLNFFLYRS